MGRICPILNHPLTDGVLVDNIGLVKFIQKRNVEFLSTELICRSCNNELSKLYNKKIKKAIELRKQSILHGSSISTLGKSSSSASSSITDISIVLAAYTRNRDVQTNGDNNGSITSIVKQNGIESGTSVERSANTSNITRQSDEIVPENQNTQKKHAPANIVNEPNVTLRKKRTIRDYLTSQSLQAATDTNSKNATRSPKTNNETNSDVIRRLSQEPSTSKSTATQPFAKTNKRPISAIVDDEDDDDECLSLNAFNGTRLPHIQPLPPKRKPQPTTWDPRILDVMDKYIMDITGG